MSIAHIRHRRTLLDEVIDMPRPRTSVQPTLQPRPAPGRGATDKIDFGETILRGGFELRAARDRQELGRLQALRALSFRGDAGASDADQHDNESLHLWIGRPDGPPLATLRLRHHLTPASLLSGYSAGFFHLAGLARQPGSALEVGRLSLHPQGPHRQLMRLIWTGIARMTWRTDAARLIGCTSLAGADPSRHGAALAYLARHHLGPGTLRPAARGAAVSFATLDREAGLLADKPPAGIPSILRFYTSLGGWVSDTLAIDTDLDTCILFTCVETAAMPDAQRRLMQALAAH